MNILLLLLFSYLLGAVPIGLWVGKAARGVDVREHGSGNIGASNVWRTLGPVLGSLVFLLDVGKGAIPTLAAHHVPHFPIWLPVMAGLAAVIGHNFSVFLGGKGGKGVATTLGVALGLSWQAALIGFAVWGVCLFLTRYISVSSVVGVPVGAFLTYWWNGRAWPYGLFALAVTGFVVYRHRANFVRLRAGTEPKVGRKKVSV